MKDKKSTSRIIHEMDETMRGLDHCEALTTIKLEKFKKGVEDKTQQTKSLDGIKTDKSQTSK